MASALKKQNASALATSVFAQPQEVGVMYNHFMALSLLQYIGHVLVGLFSLVCRVINKVVFAIDR